MKNEVLPQPIIPSRLTRTSVDINVLSFRSRKCQDADIPTLFLHQSNPNSQLSARRSKAKGSITGTIWTLLLEYSSVSQRCQDNREVKIPRFRFTGTGDIHVPVPVNRGTTCNLRNPRYFGVSKPIREWQLSLLRFAIDCWKLWQA
jgi:hypothetical protein